MPGELGGGSLPHADMLYVREFLPEMVRKAQRYNAARAAFINARVSDEPSDALRRKAEDLRDELVMADRARVA